MLKFADRPDFEALLERAPSAFQPLRVDSQRGRRSLTGDVDTLTSLVKWSLGRGVSADDLLGRFGPAKVVLEVAQQRGATSTGPERAEWEGFRTALGEQLAARAGSDPAVWRVLRQRLPRFRGSVTELLDDAVARAAKGEGSAPGWPEAAGLPARTDPVKLKGVRAAFVTMLDAARPGTQRKLLSFVDDQTAHDLLALGQWRPELLDIALSGTRRDRVSLARHHDLPVEAVTALAELDDPAVNAGLFHQRRLTREQWQKLLVGAPFGAGGTARVPIDDNLRAELLKRSGGVNWQWLVPMVGCGDPELVRHFFRAVKLNPKNMQLRLLLGLWERNGQETFRKNVDTWMPSWFQAKVRDLLTELLAAEDAETALERLRTEVDKAESPQRLIQRYRVSSRDIDRTLAEGFIIDWDVLVAAQERENLVASTDLAILARIDGCPDSLRAKARKQRDGAPFKVREDLRKLAATDATALVTREQPAQDVVAAVLAEAAAHEEMASLVHKHLSGKPDAWLLALQMLPDFVGTVPELLETASLAMA